MPPFHHHSPVYSRSSTWVGALIRVDAARKTAANLLSQLPRWDYGFASGGRAMLPVFLIPSPTLSICRSCNPDGNNRENSLPSPPTGGSSVAGATDQASWLSKHPNSSLLVEQRFHSGSDTLSWLPGPANLLPPVPPGRAEASL